MRLRVSRRAAVITAVFGLVALMSSLQIIREIVQPDRFAAQSGGFTCWDGSAPTATNGGCYTCAGDPSGGVYSTYPNEGGPCTADNGEPGTCGAGYCIAGPPPPGVDHYCCITAWGAPYCAGYSGPPTGGNCIYTTVQSCVTACAPASSASSSASSVRCGDGIVNTGEKCDNGANNMSCGPYTSAWCKTNCTKPACSDGIDNDGDGKVDGADGGCVVYPDTPPACGGTASSYGGYAWGNLRAQAAGGMAAPGKDDEGCAAGTYPREDGSCVKLTCPASVDRPVETFSCRDQCTFGGSVDEGCVAFCVCNCDNGSGDEALSCYDSCMAGSPPPNPLACGIPDESCCRGGCINSFCPAGDDDDNGGGIPGGGGGIPGGGGGIAGAIAGDGGTTTGTTGTTTGTTSGDTGGDTGGTGGSSASSRRSSSAGSLRSSSRSSSRISSASSIRSSSRASSRASSVSRSSSASVTSCGAGQGCFTSAQCAAIGGRPGPTCAADGKVCCIPPGSSSSRRSSLSSSSSRSLSSGAFCGNGRVEYGEECDAGAGNSDTEGSTCRTDCTLWFCGDGVVDSEGPDYATVEQCDCGLGRFDSMSDDPADFECTQTLNGQTVKCTYYCQVTYCYDRQGGYMLSRENFPCVNGKTKTGLDCAVCTQSSSSRSSVSSRSSAPRVTVASAGLEGSSSRRSSSRSSRSGISCNGSTDCPGGEQCVNGVCAQASSRSSVRTCDDATDCAWGQICSNGICRNLSSRSSQRSSLRPCQSDVECPNGQMCFDGFCRNPGSSRRSQRSSIAGCTADWQCPTGNCENGVCTGQSSSPVLIGGLCTGTECSMGGDAFCGTQGKSCQTMQEFPCLRCVPPAASSESSEAFSAASVPFCSSDSQCPGGRCIDGSCVTFGSMASLPNLACADMFDCAPGYACVDGRCVAAAVSSRPALACSSDDQCSAGDRCIDGTCRTRMEIAQLPSFCGNARVDPGETCDNGMQNSDAPNALCRTDCSIGRCGDGILDTPLELCDDGNLTRGDGCDAVCRPERAAPNEALPAQVVEIPLQPGQSSAGQTAGYVPSDTAPQTPAPPSTADSGPAALAVMAAGAAAGYGWMRRKRRS